MAVRVSTAQLTALQGKVDNIRNICILAHVDHGKTTLSDGLISSNGIISDKLAGKMRYLDSTEEEQVRGITMKSSAISLLYTYRPPGEEESMQAPTENQQYLINLIDSPGHVDFSSDVSTAVRLCDGALVVVDVLEGVCAQTHAVLRQAWAEGVRPCLVLNKMDRLIVELQFSPTEAFMHLRKIIEQVNAIISSLLSADVMASAGLSSIVDSHQVHESSGILAFDEEQEEALAFSPEKGNVVFASAVDGWAFGIGYFARSFSKKLDCSLKTLLNGLWGDFYWDHRTKGISSKPIKSGQQTMFAQMVLEPLWSVYNAVLLQPDSVRTEQILKSLRIFRSINKRDLEHSDRKVALSSIMRKWLPLSGAILRMVTRVLPSPRSAQKRRVERLWPSASKVSSMPETLAVKDHIASCDASEMRPVVAFVSKMISVEKSLLSDQPYGEDDSGECLVAFSRIFSGTLRSGHSQLFVLQPKYTGNPQCERSLHQWSELQNPIKLYMMMGRELVAVDSVPSGNIAGVLGLSDAVLKTATLSSTPFCPSLTKMPSQAQPIVRVAVEPENHRDLAQLERGLQLLYKADPMVEVVFQGTGELIVVALGELHLEICMRDLRDRFAKVPIRVSAPIVNFRETIADGNIVYSEDSALFQKLFPDVTSAVQSVIKRESRVAIEIVTPNKQFSIRMKALAIPLAIMAVVEDGKRLIKGIANLNEKERQHGSQALPRRRSNSNALSGTPDSELHGWTERLRNAFIEAGGDWEKYIRYNGIAAFGPNRTGPNLLITAVPNCSLDNIVPPMFESYESDMSGNSVQHLEGSVLTGFQLATSSGPLCEEPMWGVAFIYEGIMEHEGGDVGENDHFGPISGQIISTMRVACRLAFLRNPVRLVEAIYRCTLQCQAEQLGNLYGVISRRRGRVISDELEEGTSTFSITANIPVVDSFGLAEELLKRTSGAVSSPQLVLSHWEVIDVDPFFQPRTLEEREEHGEKVFDSNIARKYIDAVRRRKGLPVEEKLVVHAEKQRTLTRMK